MKSMQAAVLLACVMAAEASYSFLQAPGPKDKASCCTTCHRFGMKVLGEWNPAFVGISSPVDCCDVCSKVFTEAVAKPASAMVQEQPTTMTANKCKTICHRFGMRTLGGEFKDLTSPVECAALCDKKYS